MNEQPSETERAGFLVRYRRASIIGAVVLLIIVGAVIYWLVTRGKETTDDAQINSHLVSVTARVSGNVQLITVDDTDKVKAGQLLVQIDPRDYQQALRSAEANLAVQIAQTSAATKQTAVTGKTAPSTYGQAAAEVRIAAQGVDTAQAQVASAEAQMTAAEAGVGAAREQATAAATDVDAAAAQVKTAQEAVTAAQADVAAAESEAKTQATELARYKAMLAGGAVSQQQFDIVQNRYNTTQASLRAAQSRLISARASVTQATARQAGSKALQARANSQVASSVAALTQSQAGVRAARVGLLQARSRLSQARAALHGTETVPQQIGISEAQRRAAAAKIAQARADVQAAKLNLSYTTIRAPMSGQISNRSAQLGQHVSPGQALMSIVPLPRVWVVANYKETQIGHMHRGQRADITVDTYPGVVLHGYVQGIGAASGEITSLLPPQNATGNFVKVVQRIPVRIFVDEPIPRGIVLRPGQNVIATVHVR